MARKAKKARLGTASTSTPKKARPRLSIRFPKLGALRRIFGVRSKASARPVPNAELAALRAARVGSDVLWGEGFATPGGKDFVLDLLRGVELPEGAHIAELEAGRGGASCVVAEMKAGVRVAAIGRSSENMAAVSELSRRMSVAERVTPTAYDPANPSLPEAAYDHVFAKDGVPLDAKLLKAVHGSLKPKGRLLLAQLVGNGGGVDLAGLDVLPAWSSGGLPNHKDLVASLEGSGFRIIEDKATTDMMGQEIQKGWARFVDALRHDPKGWGDLREILAACERWVRISTDLRSGNLEHHVITAERT